jgi:hypothetical protein
VVSAIAAVAGLVLAMLLKFLGIMLQANCGCWMIKQQVIKSRRRDEDRTVGRVEAVTAASPLL